MPPGPRQGKSEMTILPQKPISKRGKSLVPPTAAAASVPQMQPLRRMWQGDVGWTVSECGVSCTDSCSEHNPPHSRKEKWSGINDEPQQYRFFHDSPDSTFPPCTSLAQHDSSTSSDGVKMRESLAGGLVLPSTWLQLQSTLLQKISRTRSLTHPSHLKSSPRPISKSSLQIKSSFCSSF